MKWGVSKTKKDFRGNSKSEIVKFQLKLKMIVMFVDISKTELKKKKYMRKLRNSLIFFSRSVNS